MKAQRQRMIFGKLKQTDRFGRNPCDLIHKINEKQTVVDGVKQRKNLLIQERPMVLWGWKRS